MSGFTKLRYQSFADEPAPDGDARESAGERFEAILARARGRARADGFEEGVAHAEARFERETRDRIDAIAASLADAEAAARAAEERTAAAIHETISAFVSAISPRLREIGAADAAAACIADIVRRSPGARPVLEVAKDGLDETRVALRRSSLLCEVRANADLAPGVARIAWSGGFDEIDIRPAVEAATEALSPAPARARRGRPEEETR